MSKLVIEQTGTGSFRPDLFSYVLLADRMPVGFMVRNKMALRQRI
jgi:hypothetical protein